MSAHPSDGAAASAPCESMRSSKAPQGSPPSCSAAALGAAAQAALKAFALPPSPRPFDWPALAAALSMAHANASQVSSRSATEATKNAHPLGSSQIDSPVLGL